MKTKCPICGKKVTKPSGKDRQRRDVSLYPFCSERCKWVDLGGWLEAKYKMPVEDDEEQEVSADETIE